MRCSVRLGSFFRSLRKNLCAAGSKLPMLLMTNGTKSPCTTCRPSASFTGHSRRLSRTAC